MATTASFYPQSYAYALGPETLADAYPLVRVVAPEISLRQWLDYAGRRCREGGMVGLLDETGEIMGLLSYRATERLRHGRVLALDDFVTFELSRAAPRRAALLSAAEDLARSLGCTRVEARVGGSGFGARVSALPDGWPSLGLELDSVIFARRL